MDRKWFQGFVEGSGCFSIIIRKSPNRVGWQTVADFTLKLPLGQKALLEEIRSFLGAGKVYQNKRQAILKVTSHEEAGKLASFFGQEEFISPAKKNEFLIWSQCVSLMGKGAHHTPEGVLEIAHLRDSVHLKRLWNKKNFCSLRKELDPCHVYQETHSLPAGCRICWTGGEKHLVQLPVKEGG